MRDKDAENMSDRYLRDIIISFITAGKDTTAGTLSWFFYLLCKHPHEEEKIFQDVKASVRAPETTSVQIFIANMTEEFISKMTYLHTAIIETLRLYPAAAMLSWRYLKL